GIVERRRGRARHASFSCNLQTGKTLVQIGRTARAGAVRARVVALRGASARAPARRLHSARCMSLWPNRAVIIVAAAGVNWQSAPWPAQVIELHIKNALSGSIGIACAISGTPAATSYMQWPLSGASELQVPVPSTAT